MTTYGSARRRTATAFFNVRRAHAAAGRRHLAARRINVWDGDNYAWELTGVLGMRDTGGAVRAGPGALQRPLATWTGCSPPWPSWPD